MKVETSGVPFSYTTIKVTRSRIDKGLLAIPVSLIDLFPKTNGDVYLLDENGQWVRTTFTARESECARVTPRPILPSRLTPETPERPPGLYEAAVLLRRRLS